MGVDVNGRSGLLEALAQPLCDFDEASAAQVDHGARGDSTRTGRASPSTPCALAENHARAARSFLETLLQQPARAAGMSRWGLSEFRIAPDWACFFKWLYPRARVLMLYENPYTAFARYVARLRDDCSNSAEESPGSVRATRRPNAREFGRLWRRSAIVFEEQARELGGLTARREDLRHGDFDSIEAYLGWSLDRSALPSSVLAEAAANVPVDPRELAVLAEEVEPVARRLGYFPAAEPTPNTTPIDLEIRAAPRMAASPREKCVVLVPVGGMIEPGCEEALRELERRGYVVRRVRGYAAVDQARNQMATDALADGFAETLWIDSDIEFHPDDVDKLRARGLPLACGVYPKKGVAEIACHVLPGTDRVVFGVGGGLLEIRYAGAGFLLARREVYETIQRKLGLPTCNLRWRRPMIPFFQPLVRPDADSPWYLAEDYAFCHRARACGYSLWADTTIRLGHVGKCAFGWEDASAKSPRFATFTLTLRNNAAANS